MDRGLCGGLGFLGRVLGTLEVLGFRFEGAFKFVPVPCFLQVQQELEDVERAVRLTAVLMGTMGCQIFLTLQNQLHPCLRMGRIISPG